MNPTIPTGWKRRHHSDGQGAFTVSLYNTNHTHVGHYRFAGYGSQFPWRFEDAQFATEEEALAALLKEINE